MMIDWISCQCSSFFGKRKNNFNFTLKAMFHVPFHVDVGGLLGFYREIIGVRHVYKTIFFCRNTVKISCFQCHNRSKMPILNWEFLANTLHVSFLCCFILSYHLLSSACCFSFCQFSSLYFFCTFWCSFYTSSRMIYCPFRLYWSVFLSTISSNYRIRDKLILDSEEFLYEVGPFFNIL